MSWQGLWFTFARLENVVGAFNANKLSRTEKNWFREAGNKPYNIHVSEIGFSDPTRDPLLLKRKVLEADKAKQEVESLLDSSTEESGRSLPELSRIRKNKLLELEIIIVSGMNKLIKRSTQDHEGNIFRPGSLLGAGLAELMLLDLGDGGTFLELDRAAIMFVKLSFRLVDQTDNLKAVRRAIEVHIMLLSF
ncbi:hypothetical protein V6N11_036488 [Hibiscus sabdariffa]|uniref:Uncharacterized protein n=1 Tax=Hibiscus sabdariffa TaxID=183260 RepID=A0ABR2RB31_9ROSI